jgi:polyphosphate glucokinase
MKKILVVDVGGTNIKLLATGQAEQRKIPSGKELKGQDMVEKVKEAAKGWEYDVISIGYPGPVIHGKIMKEPVNLGPGWLDFDFAARFGKPVKIVNDAAMQAIGSYKGDRMLFLGLGTGLGSTLIADNVVMPMELGHLPYRKDGTFEDYVGQRGYDRIGKKDWRAAVDDVVQRMRSAFLVDYVVLGGGNSKKLKELPEGAILGSNENAFAGGFRMWEGEMDLKL